jgi:hypothetical protein
MINIHADLCPSGPYAWKHDQFWLAMRNMGIRKVDTVDIKKGALQAELDQAEKKIRAHLDAGKLCVMDFLEHQLVSGYDTKGFIILQPWKGESKMELPSLTFGTWKEALDREGWVMFTLLEKDDLRSDETSLLRSALTTAIRIQTSPQDFQLPGYQVGDGAWEWWLAGIDKGLGKSHGHWWNGMVWEECRRLAAEFFEGLEPSMQNGQARKLCNELASLYKECGAQLNIAKDRKAPADTQKAALVKGRDLDRKCTDLMKELLVAVIS